MQATSIELNQVLPAEIAAGSPGWWLSYRRYPVFSWPWVWRRALLFGLFIVAWGALSGIGHYASGGPLAESLALLGWFVLGFGTVVNAGPMLAAGVRHRGWPVVRERIGVGLAMILGLALALAADWLSSARIAELVGETYQRELTGSALFINLAVLLGIYLLLGGGLALRAYFSEARRLAEFHQHRALAQAQAEKLAADQKLAVLQAQIEPHFLFNTLAGIRSDLHRSPARAEQTLDALCAYLRAAIPRLDEGQGAELSTLGEQVELCRHYLSIMRGRMRERLEFSIDLGSRLQHHPFPPFLLLSLVENAIKHGLEPSPAGGRIQIVAETRAARVASPAMLKVCVIDSGLGLSGTPGSGVGLSNIREQLRLRHADRARLSLSSTAGGGVTAAIEVPLEVAS